MTLAIATSSIVQQAFRFMGISGVASFGDDSDEANAAREQYDSALGLCLEAVDWSFASVIADLPEAEENADVPTDPELPHRFTPPADMAALRQVMTQGVEYRLDQNVLRTDTAGPIKIRYTARITDESRLPETFKVAAALQLAVLLAPEYVKTARKQEQLAAQLDNALHTHARTDARTASARPYREEAPGGPVDWVTEALR